jgi:REP element-mobilizing transposase RayT
MDRFWLLTSTTYGNWLPGDPRGFVGTTKTLLGVSSIRNLPGTEHDRDNLRLRNFARSTLKGPPILLSLAQACVMHSQFHETAAHKGWMLSAVGIMANHIHLVVGVPGDPDPETVLGVFKSYGSRALNRNWQRPESEMWWTESGSKRKLRDEAAVLAAVEYVRNQAWPLVIWIAGENPRPQRPSGMK